MKNCNKKCKRPGFVLKKIERRILATVANNRSKGWPTTTILDLIELLRISERQAYYNVGKLLNRGLLENKGKSVYLLSITEKGMSYITAFLGELQGYGQSALHFLDRAHKLTVVAKLAYRPEGLVPDGFVASAKSQNLKFKRPVLTYVDKQGRFTVQITEGTVSFCFQEVYGIDPHHLVHMALNKAVYIASGLREHGFKVLMPSYAVVDQQHALSNGILAEFTAKYDIHYKSDRLEFDKSVAPNEFELIDKTSSPGDFLRLTDWLEAIVRGEVTLPQIRELCQLLPELRRIVAEHGLFKAT